LCDTNEVFFSFCFVSCCDGDGDEDEDEDEDDDAEPTIDSESGTVFLSILGILEDPPTSAIVVS